MSYEQEEQNKINQEGWVRKTIRRDDGIMDFHQCNGYQARILREKNSEKYSSTSGHDSK